MSREALLLSVLVLVTPLATASARYAPPIPVDGVLPREYGIVSPAEPRPSGRAEGPRDMNVAARIRCGFNGLYDSGPWQGVQVDPQEGVRSGPCPEVVGELRAFAPVFAIPAPYAAVFDPDASHPFTGKKFIVTSCAPDNHSLYTVGSNGENPQLFSVGALTTDGRGVTIGGKAVLGQDFIFGAGANGEVVTVEFDGFPDDIMGTQTVQMAGIAWDSQTNTLLIYDRSGPMIRQYDVVSRTQRAAIAVSTPWGLGIAYDACNGRVFISQQEMGGFFEATPSYDGSNRLVGLTGLVHHNWNFGTSAMIDDVKCISYRSDLRQLVAVNGEDTSQYTGIATSIDEGCCLYIDINTDGEVNLADAQTMMRCVNGPGNTSPPSGVDPQHFLSADSDDDGDVDLPDFARFQREYVPIP